MFESNVISYEYQTNGNFSGILSGFESNVISYEYQTDSYAEFNKE